MARRRINVAETSIEPLLEQYRARRAWVRYWINFYIADNVGVFFKTVRTTVDVICPTWDGETKTWLEPGPYRAPAGFFPTPYSDRLLSGVRWRVMGLRSVRSRGKRPLRVWPKDWPHTHRRPSKGWLADGKITTPEAIEDYNRLYDVIDGLDQLHAKLLKSARKVRDRIAKCDGLFTDQLNEMSVPLLQFK